jgi:hypothetical protein
MMGAQRDYEQWMAAVAKRPPRDALLEVIKALQARDGLVASVPPMRALCRLYPENSEKVRLKLASILIKQLERPTEALRQLEQIPEGSLAADLDKLRGKLLMTARQMIADGVLEVEEEA